MASEFCMNLCHKYMLYCRGQGMEITSLDGHRVDSGFADALHAPATISRVFSLQPIMKAFVRRQGFLLRQTQRGKLVGQAYDRFGR